MAFPNNNLTQTAVYWGSPTNDGYGGFTYADPVEISCRWEYKRELFMDNEGRQLISNAGVQVSQDLDIQGLLFLGDLDDLDSDQEESPIGVDGVFEIKQLDKIPTINGSAYYREVWL